MFSAPHHCIYILAKKLLVSNNHKSDLIRSNLFVRIRNERIQLQASTILILEFAGKFSYKNLDLLEEKGCEIVTEEISLYMYGSLGIYKYDKIIQKCP